MSIRMQPEDRKAQLLDAAVKVARKVGYRAVTRELVAAEAGVSPGLVTRYFADMATLQDEIVRQGVKDKNIPIITDGLVAGHRAARKVAKDPAMRDAVMAHLF